MLTAALAVAYIRGVQREGVACCVKHFVGNDTEFERMTISSEIDERTLRELYLVPFERAVTDAGVRSIMTAYNRLNGTYCGEHPWLISDVLRGEWGFDGVVISDWFGTHSAVESLRAGLDLEMPGPPASAARTCAAPSTPATCTSASWTRGGPPAGARRVDGGGDDRHRRGDGRRRGHARAHPAGRGPSDGAAEGRGRPAAAGADHPAQSR